MCNLYRMDKSAAEVARIFGVGVPAPSNAGAEIYPGYPGWVVAERALRTMTWGFPLALTSKKTGKKLKPKPINNTRSDKLDRFMWRYSFAERRCLIPVSRFAEAEGPKGAKTRTWFSMPDQPVFAVAGIWRDTDEWGPAYSMIMTDAAGIVAEVHDRMPLVLHSGHYRQWTDGAPEEARELCKPYNDNLAIERTDTPWVLR